MWMVFTMFIALKKEADLIQVMWLTSKKSTIKKICCLLAHPQLCAFKTSISNSFCHGPRRNIFLLLRYWDQILKILRLNPK